MQRLLIATANTHKTNEFKSLLKNKFVIDDLSSIGYKQTIIESGSTFIENALIKCNEVYNQYKIPVLADDSGLHVNALDGAPGVHSARYGGEGLTDIDRYTLLLENMKDKTDRSASFVCALVFFFSPSKIYIIQEECKGIITNKPSGLNGFGYDPVFFLKDLKMTMAELSDIEKNKISHRGKATAKIISLL